jgi:hypothetical protein
MDTNDLMAEVSKIERFERAGLEPYKLYAWISTHFSNKVIFDVGTFRGHSAEALAYNKTNRVISYDIVQTNPIQVDNVTYRIGDFRKDPELFKSPLLVIDVAPHDGIQEQQFLEFLMKRKYKGIVVWDDISYHNFPGMATFWDGIPQTKYDLTFVGHHSGTGLTVFE